MENLCGKFKFNYPIPVASSKTRMANVTKTKKALDLGSWNLYNVYE